MEQQAQTVERVARKPAEPLKPVVDPAGWTKDDVERSDDWIFTLSPAHVDEIDAAVAAVESSGRDILDIRRADFALPALGPALEDVRDEVIDGRGFALVRGLPVARYSRHQAAVAFWGIGCHIGVPVSQNAKGHLLGHVKDLGGKSFSNPTHRGYQTHDSLPFHSDSCDVVALLCLHPSKGGGLSTIVSSVTVYNEMLKRRPDLVAELVKPIYRDRRNEIPQGKDPWFQLPVFTFEGGRLTTSYQGGYIRSAKRFEALPPRSPALEEALEMFDDLVRELCAGMEFRQGDMQFLHNHVVLHSRTEFEDYPEPERRRHLLRLWLSTPGGRPLAPAFADRYGHLAPGERPSGGIVVPGTVFKAPLEAE